VLQLGLFFAWMKIEGLRYSLKKAKQGSTPETGL